MRAFLLIALALNASPSVAGEWDLAWLHDSGGVELAGFALIVWPEDPTTAPEIEGQATLYSFGQVLFDPDPALWGGGVYSQRISIRGGVVYVTLRARDLAGRESPDSGVRVYRPRDRARVRGWRWRWKPPPVKSKRVVRRGPGRRRP